MRRTDPANLNNFTNGGTLNNGAALNFSGGVNASTGTINVSSTLNTQDFGTNGVMTINNGGTVNNSGSNFVAGGGSRTTINSGGTLATTNGTSIELNGALLTNNGTQNGLLDVNYGSSARGSGVFGTVNVTTGGKFGNNTINNGLELQVGGSLRLAPAVSVSPRPFVGPQLSTTPTTITVGGMLLGAGSNLGINVQNAQGTAGTGYDTFHDLGALTLNGASTPGNQIVISLASLNASGNPGLALNFDPTRSSAFTLVTADGGITGYNAGEFAVDTSGFSNALDGGNFSVAENGNLLQLDFIPSGVPEPSTWIFAAMVSTAGVARWARKRRVTPV